MSTATTERRIDRLSTASLARVIEPDLALAGHIGPGQVLPDELLSVHGLDLPLGAERRAALSREEAAALARSGIAFEAVLIAGFSVQIARAADVTDPAITYLLHELGEETRHQRTFQRVLRQLAPTAVSRPRALDRLLERVGPHVLLAMPGLFLTLVLGGEEIPDLLQARAAEHPGTDPFLAEVNRYHRAEEARHLSYARTIYAETWDRASRLDRVAVRHVAPWVIGDLFRSLVPPSAYAAVGLPARPTWQAVQACPHRVALRHQATRPVLQPLLEAGVFGRRGVTRGWRDLCGVDVAGHPVDGGGTPG